MKHYLLFMGLCLVLGLLYYQLEKFVGFEAATLIGISTLTALIIDQKK